MHGALGIVLMGARVAKVDEQAIARYCAMCPSKRWMTAAAVLLVGAHHLAQVFGVELLAQPGWSRPDHRTAPSLPSFGIWVHGWAPGEGVPALSAAAGGRVPVLSPGYCPRTPAPSRRAPAHLVHGASGNKSSARTSASWPHQSRRPV